MTDHVDVEIVLKKHKDGGFKNMITKIVRTYLENLIDLRENTIIKTFQDQDMLFFGDIDSIIVGEVPGGNKSILNLSALTINWYLYSLETQEPVLQKELNDDQSEELVISTQLSLPSVHLSTLWENLYYENDIKLNLLKYARTMMEFSDKGVDSNVVSCNRVLLLHGPPGTGKTSLCKALAHKLAIRMNKRFSSGLLIEINSHSLFSKWFSESGKLVNKMFQKIREILENHDVLVCLLIDEIESLAHARDQCTTGAEPSDSIRVVNTLLTQIDQIKTYPNILIFATSNMTETIDLAFVDRADIKQYLGLPSVAAIYNIYYTCIQELMKADVIIQEELKGIESRERLSNTKLLWRICQKSDGLSGRLLRKIPFLAQALFLNKSPVSLEFFLLAMEKAVEKEHCDREHFKTKKQKIG